MRTVVVGLRNRAKVVGEKREDCKAGLQEMLVPVQRLVVVLPAEEQGTPSDQQPEPLPPRSSSRLTRAKARREALQVEIPEAPEEILDL